MFFRRSFHFCMKSWTTFTFSGEAGQLSLFQKKLDNFHFFQEKLDNFHAVKGELPEWFDNWDPNLPLAQVLNFVVFSKQENLRVVICFTCIPFFCFVTWNKCDNNQEMLGWGVYLPFPGFDKKGRMVLFCRMEVPHR